MALAGGVDEEVHHRRPHIHRRDASSCGPGWPGSGRCRCRGCSGCGRRPRSSLAERTAVILVWLRGGCSHLDTYDPKPDAPSEYRGPFAHDRHQDARACASPSCCRGRPRLADRFTVLRSMAHTGGGHPAGSLQLLSGDPDRAGQARAGLPRLHERRPLPAVRAAPATLPELRRRQPGRPLRQLHDRRARPTSAPSYEPFAVTGDPNAPNFQVPNIGLADPGRSAGSRERVGLRQVVRRPPPRPRPLRRDGRDGRASRPRRWTC